eukprot:g19897.t1
MCSLDSTAIIELSRRVFRLGGWHTEFYVEAEELEALSASIAELPKASIDHLGLSRQALPFLLELVKEGVKVKATGFGRLQGLQPLEALEAIHQVDPAALLFGSDLPCTRAPRPFHLADVHLIEQHFGDDAERICLKNAMDFYGVEEAS